MDQTKVKGKIQTNHSPDTKAGKSNMNLDYEKVLTRANQLYTEAKIELRKEQLDIGIPEGTAYAIHSDQVKSVLKALIEELNKWKH